MLRYAQVVAKAVGTYLIFVTLAGCHSLQVAEVAPAIRPHEGNPTSLYEYQVNPPDLLYIEMEATPSKQQVIRPGDVVAVNVLNALEEFPIADTYVVQSDGTVEFVGYPGTVVVGGLTVDQAREAIQNHLKKELSDPVVTASLVGTRPISGEYLVRPDGTVKLGFYGTVHVAGQPLSEVENTISEHLAENHGLISPRVSVDVSAYNSSVYYIIGDGAGFGDTVTKLPVTGKETVLDAVGEVGGLPQNGSKFNIWISRPVPGEPNAAEILPVDWVAITKQGQASTNYQILPGDRLYVKGDKLVATDNFLAKILAPITRVAGAVTLFDITIDSVSGSNNNQNNNF